MRYLSTLLTGVAVLAVAASTNADITNGGFDDGLSGWTEIWGDVSVVDIVGDPAARLGESSSSDVSLLSQTFDMDSGPEVTLSFRFAMFSDTAGFGDFDFPFDAFQISLFDEDFNPLMSTGFGDEFLWMGMDYEDPFDLSSPLVPVIDVAPEVEVTDLTYFTNGTELGLGGLVTIDITDFGGMPGILDFVLADGDDGLQSYAIVDGVSVTVIPLPGSVPLALVGLGSLAGFGALRRHKTSNLSAG